MPDIISPETSGQLKLPAAELIEVLRDNPEGMLSGFTQEISHSNILGLNNGISLLERVGSSEPELSIQIAKIIDQFKVLQEKLGMFKNVEIFSGAKEDQFAAELAEVAAAARSLKQLAIEMMSSLGEDSGEDGKQNNVRDALIDIIDHSDISCIENLMLAIDSPDANHGSTNIANSVHDTLNPQDIAKVNEYGSGPTSALQLLMTLTYGKSLSRIGSDVCAEAVVTRNLIFDQNGKSLEAYLQAHGFEINADIPEDLTMNEMVFDGIIKRMIEDNFQRAIGQGAKPAEPSVPVEAPEIGKKRRWREEEVVVRDEPINGSFSVSVSGEIGNQFLVIKYQVTTREEAERIRNLSQRPIEAPSKESRNENAWGPYFRSLVFKQHGKMYYEPWPADIAEEDGKYYAEIKVPIVE